MKEIKNRTLMTRIKQINADFKRTYFIITISVICIPIFSFFSFGNDNILHYENLFQQANEHYSRANYDSAIAIYQIIANAEYESSDLYYNLANGFYKTKNIPSAILYYEKAKKLAPDDADINFNLQLAEQQITDKIEPLPELFFTKWRKQIISSASLESWATWTIILSFYAMLMFVFFILSGTVWLRKLYFWSGIAGVIFAAFNFSFAIKQESYLIQNNEAIIFSPSITVKSSPDENSASLFVLHEGIKVKIHETVNDWYKISLPDGNIGWLRKEEVKVI